MFIDIYFLSMFVSPFQLPFDVRGFPGAILDDTGWYTTGMAFQDEADGDGLDMKTWVSKPKMCC